MVYTPLTRAAMRLAYEAHHGQMDKAGVPYIFHPIHLAEQMPDETACCAALLHDVLEDTALTRQELEERFPREIVETVCLLTRRTGEPYEDYIRRLRQNPTAVMVKLADLAHNLDQSRCAGVEISPQDLVDRQERYRRALEILAQ